MKILENNFWIILSSLFHFQSLQNQSTLTRRCLRVPENLSNAHKIKLTFTQEFVKYKFWRREFLSREKKRIYSQKVKRLLLHKKESKTASGRKEVKTLLNDKPSSPSKAKHTTYSKTLTKLEFTRTSSQRVFSTPTFNP